jgi:chromosome segregation ATPase
MIEFLLTLIGVLLAATVGASVEYYRQIRKAKKEYEKAKEAVEDIVLSFNRELQREADKIEIMAYRVESSTSKADAGLKRVESIEKKVAPFESQIKAIAENSADSLARVTDVDEKMRDVEASHETLKAKIAGLEEQLQKLFLEMLSMEGAKTAPEIKDRVHLSREHTARLMKKLYEEGYVERETGKIPFKYTVKKEMAKLLKKAENEQA